MDIRRAFARLLPSSVSGLDVLAIAVPVVSFIQVVLIGRLIATEILLLAVLPWLWRAVDRPRLPRWFLIVWAGWLLSQIVTDLVVGSAFDDYARGWAAIVFTLTNFAAILFIVSTPARARLFAIGLALGGFAGFLFAPNPLAAADPWKWGLALPVGLVLVAAVSGRTGDRRPWLTAAALAALAALNLLLGYRSMGGVSLLAAGYLTLYSIVSRRPTASQPTTLRAVLGLVFMAAAGLSVLAVYSVAASQGWLGSDARTKYVNQAGAFGTLLGGRPEALVSTQAILDSPVLGHGSWAKDPYYAKLLAKRQKEFGYEVTPEYVGTNLIPTHSHLLGAWVWAGFLGAVFWFAVAAVAIWLLANLYSLPVEGAPLIVFLAISLLWDIAFSPYGLLARVTAPYALVLCLLGLRQLRALRDARHAPDPAVAA